MPDQDFSSREADRDRLFRGVSRDRVVVPPDHVKNLKSVFGSTTVYQPKIIENRVAPRTVQPRVLQPSNRIAVVGRDVMPHVAVKPSVAVLADIPKPVIAVAAEPLKPIPDHKNLKKEHKKLQKEETKLSRLQAKRAKAQAKLSKKSKVASSRVFNPAQPTSQHNTSVSQSVANQVLASVASTVPTNNDGISNLAIDTGGAATLTRDNSAEHLAKFGSRIAFRINIDHKKILGFVKFLLVVGLLGISSYLAWDTWFTNKSVNYSFAQSAGATSIDDANPFNVDPTSVSNQAWVAHTTPANEPRYLYIDSINVKSRVMSVGVNSSGNIASPKNANDAAWYDGSAKPGQDGQVFINGHKSYSSSFDAVFDNLDKLKSDDKIVIETGDDTKITYKVVKVETVDADDVDMNEALNVPNGAKQGITLMTYSGKYNYRQQTAEQRVAVYAVRQ